MTALLLKLSPYLAAAALVFGGGWYAGGLAPKTALERLQAADWQAKAQGEAVARKAVEAQLAQAETVSANNAQAVERLQNENAQIAADRDRNVELARRLLVSADHHSPSGHPMPKDPDQPAVTVSGPTPGDGSVAELLADVAAECDANRAQLDGLISEVRPQL